jgi:hypothetical protein
MGCRANRRDRSLRKSHAMVGNRAVGGRAGAGLGSGALAPSFERFAALIQLYDGMLAGIHFRWQVET